MLIPEISIRLPVILALALKVKVSLPVPVKLPNPKKLLMPLLPVLVPDIVVLLSPVSVLFAVVVASVPTRLLILLKVLPIPVAVPAVKFTNTGVV